MGLAPLPRVRWLGMREVLCSIIVPVPIEVAWEVYLDFESWGLRSNLYARLEWLSGRPWHQHSRARLHQLWPAPQTVLLRILQVQRPNLLSALYHANGLTSTKSVRLHARAADSTEVQIQTECLGESLDQAIIQADVVLRQIYEKSLQDFANECLSRTGCAPKTDTQNSKPPRERSA
jgi:hypothetical protein